MNDSATKDIYDDIRYNSTNMGELGKFIRLEYVYSILDRYVIMSKNADAVIETGRIDKIRKLLSDSTIRTERELLNAIYGIVFP